MTSPPARWWLPAHPADRLGWAALAAGAALLGYALARYWGANPGHADRLLVLAGAAYAAHALAPHVRAMPARPAGWAGLPLALLAAVALPPGVYLLVRAGPRPLTLWWVAAALLLGAAGLTLARHGWGRLRAGAFPLVFPLFALPVPGVVLEPLQARLQGVTTGLAVPALRALGEPAGRDGFVITLPGGPLLVEEACSGVRSLTALTAIAGFVGFLRGFGPARGVLLVLLTVPLVVLVNAGRVVASGLIQEHVGREYVAGGWHEGLGFAAVLAGLGLVLVAAEGLGRPAADAPPGGPRPTPRPGPAGWLAVGLVVVGVLAAGGLGVRAGLALAATARAADLDALSPALGDWAAEPLPVPAAVTDLLAPDAVSYRVFRSRLGQDGHAWVLYWSGGAVVKGWHRPDICWSNRGYTLLDRWDLPLTDAGPTPAQAREFRAGRERHVVVNWVQEGDRVVPEADERAAQATGMASTWRHGWAADFLGLGDAPAGGRLMVVVAVPAGGPQARRDAADLTRRLAADVYRVCPWAVPGGG